MKISQKGIDLVKHFEGCSLTAYRRPANVLTIGYGHTGKSVKNGLTITQEQADEILKHDLESFEKVVSDCVKIELEQAQFDVPGIFRF